MAKLAVNIIFDTSTGQLSVSGPNDEILLLGIMQKAISAVSTGEKKKEQRIIPAHAIPKIRGGN